MALKMGIIGMGGMAAWHFENIKRDIPGIKVVAGYDIRSEICEERASEWGIKVYARPEQLYADKEIDLVLVATPNDTHKEYSIACLEAGKHVICEKPVTMNAAELEEIISARNAAGRLFSVHQNRRFDPDYLIVKKILAAGLLNGPYAVESRVHGSKRLYGWRLFKQNGGGLLLDWGVHLLDQMLDLIPLPVVSVYGHLHSIDLLHNPLSAAGRTIFSSGKEARAPHIGENLQARADADRAEKAYVRMPEWGYARGLMGESEIDDCLTVMLRFEGGCTGLVDISTNSYIVQPRWHLSCKDGTAIVKDWECRGKIVKQADPSEPDWTEAVAYTAAGPTRTMLPRPKETTITKKLPKIGPRRWTEYYENIVDTINGRAELLVTAEQALRVMKVIEAVFESDRTGQAVVGII